MKKLRLSVYSLPLIFNIGKSFKIPFYIHIQDKKYKVPRKIKQIKYKKGEKRKKRR